MTPYYHDEWLTILQGDVREVLPTLPADSVDCIVTSPPYWGLRDYGNDGQIGLERTPEEYVANMVGVFRELRRVLKPSGTCWLNLGDSYFGTGRGPSNDHKPAGLHSNVTNRGEFPMNGVYTHDTLKGKDLVGIPWRVAFALQADGWYLRSEITWCKPNAMPESVTDRPTSATEKLFLMTKRPVYYFDATAVREQQVSDHASGNGFKRDQRLSYRDQDGARGNDEQWQPSSAGRNIRNWWVIPSRPYKGAHFAVFPPELPERCIKAGSSERGVCPECGAPWERVVEREVAQVTQRFYSGAGQHGSDGRRLLPERPGGFVGSSSSTTGWRPTCRHGSQGRELLTGSAHVPVPAVVLDPFAGSGTTGMVANRLSRRAILIDLNGDYLKQQLQRNAQTPLGLGAA